MSAFEIDELVDRCRESGKRYLEFVQIPTMSAGVFILPAGAMDDHSPHARDELYYVVQGRGVLQVRGEDSAVSAGSTMFVPAGIEHHFHTIVEELIMLVCFGGAGGEAQSATHAGKPFEREHEQEVD
jgi:mannose-6-phosphate isomerase-like protein (cupin superfamily)